MLNSNATTTKKRFARTILIILGVVIAFLLTLGSTLMLADNSLSAEETEQKPIPSLKQGEADSRPDFNSSVRLMHIFTKNLPHLNQK